MIPLAIGYLGVFVCRVLQTAALGASALFVAAGTVDAVRWVRGK